jgi:aminopeptidase N
LQFVKFFAQFARSEKQLSNVSALLQGEIKLASLTIDTDLRWELVTALAVGGKMSVEQLDQELAADNTANGQKYHVAAVAALPDNSSKQAMFTKLVATDELSNALVNSASLAFGRVLNPEVLQVFVAKYFANVLKIWKEKTYHMAEFLLVNLYPLALANAALVSETKAFLAKPDIQSKPALRRTLIENLANVERALSAQQRDAKN